MIKGIFWWSLAIFALPVSFVLACSIGFFLFTLIETMCPAAWHQGPLCSWPWWIGHLSSWPFYFAFGAVSNILITSLAPQYKLNIGLIILNFIGAIAGLLSAILWIAEDSIVKFWASCVIAVVLAYGGGVLGLILSLSWSKTVIKDSARVASAIATDDFCT